MTNGQDGRKERLAQALRDNLRRRKAQARASESAGHNDDLLARPETRDD